MVVKPAAGVLDFGSKTMEGIKNTATLGQAVTQRRRPPRVFGPEGELTRFDATMAEGMLLLDVAAKKRPGLRRDVYTWHCPLAKNGILLMTDRHVISMRKPEGAAPELKWSVGLWLVERVEMRGLRVVIAVANLLRHKLGMGNEKGVSALNAHDASQIHARIKRWAELARQQAAAAGTLDQADDDDIFR